MWKELVRLSENKRSVIAQLPEGEDMGATFSVSGLDKALEQLGAGDYYLQEDNASEFVLAAKERNQVAYSGVEVAIKKDAQAVVELSDSDMLATMKVTGAYGGKSIKGADLLQALATSHVVKGINKLALKKVLALAKELAPGETIEQPVAKGMPAKNGTDTRFVPLVEDVENRVLRPQEKDEKTHKVDMRDLGEMITVSQGETLMKRIPSTAGVAGFNVLGSSIPPVPGKDTPLKAGKGSHIDRDNPNLLRASESGMPLIRASTVDVDPALTLKNIGVSTGHVKFKGSIVISGDIEPGMIVRATGSITVGGFIESADVQAQEDIIVGKGIIGHAVEENEEKACVVKSNGNISSKYAQYAFLQAMGDVNLELHCISCTVMCTNDLTVMDSSEKRGTLSGGLTRVGGKVTCVNLGVEGDTATHVQPFVRYKKYKKGLIELKERYEQAQTNTMKAIRSEIEMKKIPKSERDEDKLAEIIHNKQTSNAAMEQVKSKLEYAESELERLLAENVVKATNRVFTRVTVQYGDELITTKREYHNSIFSFDQYKIQCVSMVEAAQEQEEAS